MRRFWARFWNQARLLYRSELRPWIDTILSLSAILVFLYIFYQFLPDKMKIDFYKYHTIINLDSDEISAILLIPLRPAAQLIVVSTGALI